MLKVDDVAKLIVTQTHPNNPPVIQRYGCRFMSLLAIPQFWSNYILTQEQVVQVFNWASTGPKIVKATNAECGEDEHLIMNRAFTVLGLNHTCRQVGYVTPSGVAAGWNGKSNIDFDYMIVHWKTNGVDGHWTLCDINGKEIYDPHNPEEAGYRINKKVIDKKLLYKVR